MGRPIKMRIELTRKQAEVLLEFIDPDPTDEASMFASAENDFAEVLDQIAALIRVRLEATQN